MKIKYKLVFFYFMIALCTMVIGYLSRNFDYIFPAFIEPYIGDTIWATMIYWGFRMLLSKRNPKESLYYSWLFCVMIECLQLYKAPWIQAIRATTLGGLVLGFDFYWPDIICYTVGVLLGWVVDVYVVRGEKD